MYVYRRLEAKYRSYFQESSIPIMAFEDGTDTLLRNVFNQHSKYATWSARRPKALTTLWLLLLLRRYKSDRVLAFSTTSVHLRRSCACSTDFTSFSFFRSFPDIIIPSRLGPSSWSSYEWFPFVYFFHYAGLGHSICVSKPTQSLGCNIIYYIPVFN